MTRPAQGPFDLARSRLFAHRPNAEEATRPVRAMVPNKPNQEARRRESEALSCQTNPIGRRVHGEPVPPRAAAREPGAPNKPNSARLSHGRGHPKQGSPKLEARDLSWAQSNGCETNPKSECPKRAGPCGGGWRQTNPISGRAKQSQSAVRWRPSTSDPARRRQGRARQTNPICRGLSREQTLTAFYTNTYVTHGELRQRESIANSRRPE